MSAAKSQDLSAPAAPRRRTPQQERSRARVEAILAAAHELVVEAGSDALKMSDIAARAGVPIGSLYQYFPDKPAILRELATRFMTRVRDMLREGMGGLATREAALERSDALLLAYYRFFQDEPDVRDIWAATQSDKALQQLDIEDSRQNGALMAAGLAPLAAPADRARVESMCFLFAHLAGAAIRLAIAVDPDEGDRLIEELRLTMRHRLAEVLR
ncbi:TetR family transcriptional regulator [Phenylobacterium sp.]|uniref:TetR family transcriptional regulator n=1 Tax=Phenylobacterium sp. TaxID=1871053 RepID=UPI0035B19F89